MNHREWSIQQSILLPALLSLFLGLVVFAVVPTAHHPFTPIKDSVLIYGSLLLSPLVLYLLWRGPISQNRALSPWILPLLLLFFYAVLIPGELYASSHYHYLGSLRLGGLALFGMASLLFTEKTKKTLLQIWVGLGWLQTLLVLLQATGFDPFFLLTGRYGTWRIYGTIGNPNLVASFLVPLFFLTQWPLLVPNKRIRSLASVAMVLAVILTGSRVNALILVLGLLIQQILFNQKRDLSKTSIWRWSLYIGILLSTLSIGTMMGKGFTSIGGRLFFWKSSWELIKNQPLIGYGLNHFQGVYPQGAVLLASKQGAPLALPSHAHNDYLEFAVELGLIPPLILILSALWAIRVAWSYGYTHHSLALGAMVLYGVWDSSLHTTPTALLFWILLCITPPPANFLKRYQSRGRILLTVILSIITVWLLWGLGPSYEHMKAHYIGGVAEDVALRGDWEEATELFGKAYRLSPGEGVFAYWYCQGLAARGDTEEALDVARNGVKTYSRLHLYLLLAQLERLEGDEREAISILEWLLTGFPQYQEAHKILHQWKNP